MLNVYMRIAVTFLTLLLTGCSMCGNEPLHTETSPDGKLVAIAFLRDCGATTAYSTQVSIFGTSSRLRELGDCIATALTYHLNKKNLKKRLQKKT
jgi:hypothetical protein